MIPEVTHRVHTMRGAVLSGDVQVLRGYGMRSRLRSNGVSSVVMVIVARSLSASGRGTFGSVVARAAVSTVGVAISSSGLGKGVR